MVRIELYVSIMMLIMRIRYEVIFFLSTMTLMARINMICDGGLENRMEAFEIWGDLRFHCLQKASGTSLLPKYLQEMSYNSLLMVFSTKGIAEDTRALAYNYLAIYLDKW